MLYYQLRIEHALQFCSTKDQGQLLIPGSGTTSSPDMASRIEWTLWRTGGPAERKKEKRHGRRPCIQSGYFWQMFQNHGIWEKTGYFDWITMNHPLSLSWQYSSPQSSWGLKPTNAPSHQTVSSTYPLAWTLLVAYSCSCQRLHFSWTSRKIVQLEFPHLDLEKEKSTNNNKQKNHINWHWSAK